MSNIKLVHSGGNSVSLTTPDSNPAANRTFKLPGADGTPGQAMVTDGSGALSFATVGGVTTGGLIETITGQCDGRVVVGASGNYTLENVTAHQNTTDTFTDLTGSSITYTPPTGTKKVVYRFSVYHSATAYSGIAYMKLLVDGTEVTQGREVISYDYSAYAHSVSRLSFEYTFITDASSEDVANGKFTSWSSGKTLKYQTRRHGNSYTATFHKIKYWESGGGSGAATNEVKVPMLTIQSFA
tara:strand:+ start:96 stop:818 length:723 start_codon:yes stop_codon:yes gene_type:complete